MNRPIRVLVAKVGLDGHDRGAHQHLLVVAGPNAAVVVGDAMIDPEGAARGPCRAHRR